MPDFNVTTEQLDSLQEELRHVLKNCRDIQDHLGEVGPLDLEELTRSLELLARRAALAEVYYQQELTYQLRARK